MLSKTPKILIVDDERRMCRSLEILFQQEGPYETVTAHDYYEATERLREPVDVVLTDLTMPGKDGMEPSFRAGRTAGNSRDLDDRVLDGGVGGYRHQRRGLRLYCEAFRQRGTLDVARKALRRHETREGVPSPVFSRYGDLVGQSAPMQEVYRTIQKISDAEATVLISGESGTGKELVARAIHDVGPRKAKPFVALNCSAVPHELLESELFGHERGAFTGAVRRKPGRFEVAQLGTLFLDEVADMPLALQAKLLRVLQDRSFERVGGNETVSVDVRIVAATNHDLEESVREHRFREDLFYRLNVVVVHLPPLRERMEDVPLLADHFLKRKCERLGVALKELSAGALEILGRHSFPGNVRELENAIERAVVMSSKAVLEGEDLQLGRDGLGSHFEDLALPVRGGVEMLENLHGHLEKNVIERAVRMFPEKSNSELAELLGTSRRVLESRLRRYHIRKT